MASTPPYRAHKKSRRRRPFWSWGSRSVTRVDGSSRCTPVRATFLNPIARSQRIEPGHTANFAYVGATGFRRFKNALDEGVPGSCVLPIEPIQHSRDTGGPATLAKADMQRIRENIHPSTHVVEEQDAVRGLMIRLKVTGDGNKFTSVPIGRCYQLNQRPGKHSAGSRGTVSRRAIHIISRWSFYRRVAPHHYQGCGQCADAGRREHLDS